MSFKEKYLKYKKKYLELKGGLRTINYPGVFPHDTYDHLGNLINVSVSNLNVGDKVLVDIFNIINLLEDGATEGALWWNDEDGRAYIKYGTDWVDLSPPVLPFNFFDIFSLYSFELYILSI